MVPSLPPSPSERKKRSRVFKARHHLPSGREKKRTIDGTLDRSPTFYVSPHYARSARSLRLGPPPRRLWSKRRRGFSTCIFCACGKRTLDFRVDRRAFYRQSSRELSGKINCRHAATLTSGSNAHARSGPLRSVSGDGTHRAAFATGELSRLRTNALHHHR